MSTRILVVDDSSETIQLIRRALGSGYQIDTALTTKEAGECLARNAYSLMLLDVQLPGEDGFTFFSNLRAGGAYNSLPIVFLTAKNTVADKVFGLQLGAEDFITKPFDQMELKARIDSKIRKLERSRQASDVIHVGDLEINRSTQRATVSTNGDVIEMDLTPLEFKLLLLLASKPNHVFSRDDILNAVWGEAVHVYSRSVDTHISKLRKKLDSYSGLIESVHGTGYRLGEVPRERIASFNSNLQEGYSL